MKHEILASMAIVVYYSLLTLRWNVYGSSLTALISNLLMTSFALAGLLTVLRIEFHNHKLDIFKKRKDLKIILTLFFIGIISSLFNNNIGFDGIIMSLQIAGLSSLLLTFKLNYKLMKFSLNANFIYFFLLIILGLDPNEIWIGGSRNMISVVLIAQGTLFYVSTYQNKKSVSVLPALLIFLISIWAFGRGGILTTLIFLVGILGYAISSRYDIPALVASAKKDDEIKYGSYMLIGIIISLIAVTYWGITNSNLDFAVRFREQGLVETGRTSARVEYFSRATDSFRPFFWGVTIEGNEVFGAWYLSYNLHNSFLYLHATRGFLGFLQISLLVFQAFIKHIKTKNNLFLIIFVALLVRMSIDTIAFVGNAIFEPLFYLMIFSKKIASENT